MITCSRSTDIIGNHLTEEFPTRASGHKLRAAKIAFVSQPRDTVEGAEAQTGSVTIVMWELAKRMAREHGVVVFAPRAPGQATEETSRYGPRIRRMPLALRSLHKAMDLGTGGLRLRTPYFASALYFREYGMSVARELQRERPDIVHVQNSTQFLPMFHDAAPGARLFLHVHDEFLALLPERVIQPRLQHVSAVITCSEFVTRRLQQRLPWLAARIHTVGNGVDTDYFQPAENPDRDSFRILYVGRVSPEKGIHILTEAFARLATQDERYELDLVGPPGLLPFSQIQLLSGDPQIAALQQFYGTGFLSRLDKQLLRGHSSYSRALERSIPESVRNRVRFHGQLPRKMLKSAYQRVHVLAVPSVCMEPFGLPIAEAMASGLPCVASRTGGIPDILTDKETGLLFERGDVGDLSAALQRLATDAETREWMGHQARRRAEKHLDWSIAAARLESLYNQQLDFAPTEKTRPICDAST